MRMALAQAIHHARHRTVFQKHLADQPMMQAVLADMALEVEAATALTLRLGRSFDLAMDDAREAARARLLTPAVKYLGVQDRSGLGLRGDGVPRRQWLCRGERAAAALPRGAGQRDLGRLRQRDVPRRAARARARRRSRARGAGRVGFGNSRPAGSARGRATRSRRCCRPRMRKTKARAGVGRLALLAAAAALAQARRPKSPSCLRARDCAGSPRRNVRGQRHRRRSRLPPARTGAATGVTKGAARPRL